jgi:hypothetical protein
MPNAATTNLKLICVPLLSVTDVSQLTYSWPRSMKPAWIQRHTAGGGQEHAWLQVLRWRQVAEHS